jgi:hypothetical protein
MLPYLLASLPTPTLGAVPDLTIDAFLETCGRVLDAPRLATLARAAGAPPLRVADPAAPSGAAGAASSGATPAATPAATKRPLATAAERAWDELAARVDDAVVRARCARPKRDPEPFLRHPPGLRIEVEEAVARAFAAPHPGLRERALDELRWRLVDELARTAPDGFAALFARAVQLRLAWRWAAWDAEAGWRALEAGLRVVDATAGTPPGSAEGRVHDA